MFKYSPNWDTFSCNVRDRQTDRQTGNRHGKGGHEQTDKPLTTDETDTRRLAALSVSQRFPKVWHQHTHKAVQRHHPHQSEAFVCPDGARRLNETVPVNWVNLQVSALPSLIWETICMDGHFNKTHRGDHHMSPSVTLCVCVHTHHTHCLSEWLSS